jgi:2-polyprenyl-3-methyl-5-hydroxy-6-metoxy-1,4-benzoquinol methylase
MSDLRSQEIASLPWPEDGIERLNHCPMCGVTDRSVFHEGLWDNSFFAAPGRWTLWRCAGCHSAYLDPRPDRATIGLAYSRYYTHERSDTSQLPRKSIKAALGNGYRNARFGTKFEPSLAVGRFVAIAFPHFRQCVNINYRYLPKRPATSKGRVLDIGTGSGEWLLMAREAGWSVAGSEPDPVALTEGNKLGLDIRQGGVEAWEDQAGEFDAISMNHVIEHVHDPAETLRKVFELLRPGGQLFIETPNLDALGHLLFGPNWRGLETPRHLVLFNHRSLADALRAQGFVNIRYRRRPSMFREFSIRSARMAAGLDPYGKSQGDGVPVPGVLDRIRAAFTREHSEFLTLTCERPRESAARAVAPSGKSG